MGDRGNIIIRDEGAPDLYLYTHWNGSDLPKTLKRALSRKERWDDSAYLARIIFCEMVKGSEADATGFGISTMETDAGLELVVNVQARTVEKKGGKTKSFEEFVAQTRHI